MLREASFRGGLQTNSVLDLPAGVTDGVLSALCIREKDEVQNTVTEVDGCQVEELDTGAPAGCAKYIDEVNMQQLRAPEVTEHKQKLQKQEADHDEATNDVDLEADLDSGSDEDEDDADAGLVGAPRRPAPGELRALRGRMLAGSPGLQLLAVLGQWVTPATRDVLRARREGKEILQKQKEGPNNNKTDGGGAMDVEGEAANAERELEQESGAVLPPHVDAGTRTGARATQLALLLRAAREGLDAPPPVAAEGLRKAAVADARGVACARAELERLITRELIVETFRFPDSLGGDNALPDTRLLRALPWLLAGSAGARAGAPGAGLSAAEIADEALEVVGVSREHAWGLRVLLGEEAGAWKGGA